MNSSLANDSYGIWSLAPPLLALGFALLTRQVYLSLLLGIFVGYLIIDQGQILNAFFSTIEGLVDVFADAGNTRTIFFCVLVGGLVELIERNGGVNGFVHFFQRKLLSSNSKNQSKRKVELFALLTGGLVFVESSISILTMGTIFRPLFDKLGISRERLAYLADSCSAPICILIPFNAWGAYIIGILEDYKVEKPVSCFAQSIAFNFYPWAALLLLLLLVFTQKSPGPLGKFKARKNEKDDEEDGHRSSPLNMLLPLATMVICVPLFLVSSGWTEPQDSGLGYLAMVMNAIANGSGSFAVLMSVTLAVIVAFVLTLVQKNNSLHTTFGAVMSGMEKLLPLGILMMLAFSVNAICKELGTGYYVASIIDNSALSYALIPGIMFLVSSFIAFSTGTSWGTFAIMLSIAIPAASELGLPLPVLLGAVLGGGVFGDHCSPISDTTIIASTAAECEHIDHVRTQIPYAAAAGLFAVVLYVVIGLFS